MVATLVGGVLEALRIGVGFLWTAAWAIVLGLVVTSVVQVYVSKERMASVLGEDDASAIAKATVFGAASSGCSFGAVAIGKGLFKKGAHAVNVLAFMFASTNLIVELGLMIWILLGWEFLVAELLGGLVLIGVMSVIVHLTHPEALFDWVREEPPYQRVAQASKGQLTSTRVTGLGCVLSNGQCIRQVVRGDRKSVAS